MNKYIVALILTLLGWTQIQAQNTNLRSVPDVPNFLVTLNFGAISKAELTAKVGDTVVKSEDKVPYGSNVTLTVLTNDGYRLDNIYIAGKAVADLPDGQFDNYSKKTTYTYTYEVKANVYVNCSVVEKSTPGYSLSNLTQTYPNVTPVTLNSNVDPESFTVKYQRMDGTQTNWSLFKNIVFTAGKYKIQVTRPQDAIYKAIEDYNELTVESQQYQLTTTTDPYVTILDIKADGETITNTVPAEKSISFSFTTAKDYKINSIKRDGKSQYLSSANLSGAVQSDGATLYTYTASPVSADVTFGFFSTPKKLLNSIARITNLEQTAGTTLAPVAVEGVPDSVKFTIKYKYTPDGEWEDFNAEKLVPGTYPIWIYRAADLDYAEYDNSTQYRLVIKAAEPEQPTGPEKIVLNTEKLTATSVEVGKPLSTSVLSGGYAQTKEENPTTVVGTFEWKDPTTVIEKAGTAGYDVVFTPIDLRYAQAETKVTVEAIQYYTVTTGASVNGKVEIEKANAANKYEAGTTLTLVYTPAAHYQVAANQPTTYQVAKDDVITGQFEAILHKVTIAETENGSLTVKNGETVVADGAEVAEGTQLNITATPATGYKLAALTNGANPIRNNAITVEGDLNIQATFEALPDEEFVVTVADMANGKLLLLDEAGNSVNKGASVKKGTKLTVVAVADKGYELGKAGVTAKGATYADQAWQINENTTFSATFEKISYSISTTGDGAEITVMKDGKQVTAAQIGDVLKISATVTNANKRLLSLVVNGKEIANGDTYTVENAVNIVANLVDKATIQLLDLDQVVTYDGNEKQFVVRSIPAGLQGFTVTYAGVEQGKLPIDAADHTKKVYNVTITRPADEQYQAVNATGTLTIQAALANHKAPTWKDSKWDNGEEGSFEDKGATDNKTFRDVIFTPKSTNHQKVTFSVAKELDANKKIIPSVSSTNAAALRATTTSSLSVEATGGTVTFWNGTNQVTEVYEGQTIIIKGLPNAGNSSMANWTVGQTTSTDEEVSLTVAAGVSTTVSVRFDQKKKPELPQIADLADNHYTGSVIIPSITSSLSGWNIVVKAGGLVVENPTEAGAYLIYASRSEDQVYAPVNEEIGSYTIAPQALQAEAFTITASAIMKGLSLSASTLSGKAPVAGTFAWAAPETIAEGVSAEATTSKAYNVTFTPDSKNYSASGLSLTATVPFLTAEAAPVRKISFEAADHGTFIVKVNGTEVTSGTQITQGDKVEVTATPATGYSLEAVKINGTAVTGAYTVGEEGDVTIVVTFKQNASQGGDPITPDEPETIPDPVVAERTATTAVITWEKIDDATGYKLHLYAKKGDATPLKTYEFDANGNLKATNISFTLTGLTAGESYYVETVAITPQGEVKRGIELTGTPTGIEAIAKGSQLYTIKGAIVIVPTSPIEVMIISANGRPIFHDEVSGYTQVTANAGIYVVVLKQGNEQVVEKVVVK